MNQTGIVEKTDGKVAVVRISRQSACGENCASCKGGCTPTEQVVEAKNVPDAKVGDKVSLYMPSKTVLGAAAMVYVIPLGILIIAYGIISMYLSELRSIVISCAVMAVSYAVIAAICKKNKNKYQLVIEKIIRM